MIANGRKGWLYTPCSQCVGKSLYLDYGSKGRGRTFRHIVRIAKGLCRLPSYERYLPNDEMF